MRAGYASPETRQQVDFVRAYIKGLEESRRS